MLTVRNLTKKFPLARGTVTALKEVNLHIKRGEFVALMGPSGSGKSTLLSLLAGLERATSGEIEIDGRCFSTMNDTRASTFRAEHIGFVFQDSLMLPHLSLEENVSVPRLFLKKKRDRQNADVHDLLHEVGLDHRKHHLPGELSGGQQQRACIARALANSPTLLLADEPTGNLDSATGEAIIELFANIHREHGVTLVIATHDPAIAACAKRIIHICDGVIE